MRPFSVSQLFVVILGLSGLRSLGLLRRLVLLVKRLLGVFFFFNKWRKGLFCDGLGLLQRVGNQNVGKDAARVNLKYLLLIFFRVNFFSVFNMHNA